MDKTELDLRTILSPLQIAALKDAGLTVVRIGDQVADDAAVDEPSGAVCAVKVDGVRIRDIVRATSEATELPVLRLLGSTRSRDVAYPRQMAMWMACGLTGAGPAQIGRHFDRDHSTVAYAKQQVGRRLRECPETRELYFAVKKRLDAIVAQRMAHRHV